MGGTYNFQSIGRLRVERPSRLRLACKRFRRRPAGRPPAWPAPMKRAAVLGRATWHRRAGQQGSTRPCPSSCYRRESPTPFTTPPSAPWPNGSRDGICPGGWESQHLTSGRGERGWKPPRWAAALSVPALLPPGIPLSDPARLPGRRPSTMPAPGFSSLPGDCSLP